MTDENENLPTLISRAAQRLANAKSSAEVLEARAAAQAALHYAKVTKAANDTQADCLRMIVRAEMRMADEIDRGQAEGSLAPSRGDRNQVRASDLATLDDIGVSKQRVSEWREVRDAGDEIVNETIDAAVREGRTPTKAEILRAAREIKSADAKKKVSNLRAAQKAFDGCTVDDLQGLVGSGRKFGTIYADPPWIYANQGTRAATGNHYDGLTVDELCDLPIRELAADDAHLHLWTTNGFLFDCQKIFDAWGFEFRSSFIWVKPQMGIGNYWRNSHEFLLTAIRGNAKRFNDKSLKSWLECDRGAHSAKPEQVRAMIERASVGPYLELFGRRSAENWVVWGNQIERSIFDAARDAAA